MGLAMETSLTADDRAQIVRHGLTVEQVLRQIELFKHPPGYVRLERSCLPGSGIRVLDEQQVEACLATFATACAQGRFLKFTPASGAATRMFKSLIAAREQHDEHTPLPQDVLACMDGLARFAFYDDLRAVMARDGVAIESCTERRDYHPIFEYLLTERGLDYASLPKGLLKFHHYPSGSRTPFEEHLVEAAAYVRDRNGLCRLHFTVSPQHLERFQKLLESVRPTYESRYAARFDVGFSMQHPSTDTVAVDLDNNLFRDTAGQLLFRPGGHGALIENLNDLRGDIVFIKNIDNVVPDDRKEPTLHWKKVLGGYLVHLQSEIFERLAQLNSSPISPTAIGDALRFARQAFATQVPKQLDGAGPDELRDVLIAKLDRPLRVCGMMRSNDNPGGGPFWVKGRDDTSTLQIVETAQVDPDAPAQQAVLRSATYFNPVDLVCGVRNWRGEPFDLRQFVDPTAVFISQKSSGGRTLKALEHPGLWNGAMAEWNTVFVEVPAATFRPVKSVNDLLG